MTYAKLMMLHHTLDNGDRLDCYIQGDRIHFTGSPTGEHSIEYKPSAGFTQRAEAHWEGYVANAARATCQCWKCREKQQ